MFFSYEANPIFWYFQYRVIESLFVYGMKWINKKIDNGKSPDQNDKKDKSTQEPETKVVEGWFWNSKNVQERE